MRTKKPGDWIWIEDVLEVFFAPRKNPEAPHYEYQVNPNGTQFINKQSGSGTIPSVESGIPQPEVKVFVDGTVNNSKSIDKGYSVEWFWTWGQLNQMGLIAKPSFPGVGVPVFTIRFAAWDLSLYSPLRLNRYTTPGNANPHQTQYYRSLILLPKKAN